MFIITAIVYLIGALAFIVLGQGETQEWAKKRDIKTNSISEELSMLS